MKVMRSYWLGLGSGLILSAMLMLVVSLQQVQTVIPHEPSSVKQEATPPPTEQTKQPDSQTAAQSTGKTQLVQDSPINTLSSTQIEWPFVIPDGSSTEQIAELLVAQGFLKDKEKFLESAHQKGVESKFRAGTFTLSLGLTTDELIQRLLK
jgi:hypothetical protein